MRPTKKPSDMGALDELMMGPSKKPGLRDAAESGPDPVDGGGDDNEVGEKPDAEPKGDPAELISSIQAQLDELSQLL